MLWLLSLVGYISKASIRESICGYWRFQFAAINCLLIYSGFWDTHQFVLEIRINSFWKFGCFLDASQICKWFLPPSTNGCTKEQRKWICPTKFSRSQVCFSGFKLYYIIYVYIVLRYWCHKSIRPRLKTSHESMNVPRTYNAFVVSFYLKEFFVYIYICLYIYK